VSEYGYKVIRSTEISDVAWRCQTLFGFPHYCHPSLFHSRHPGIECCLC